LREVWKNIINEIELFEVAQRLETEWQANAQLNMCEKWCTAEKVD
jgi:hypothetical protein